MRHVPPLRHALRTLAALGALATAVACSGDGDDGGSAVIVSTSQAGVTTAQTPAPTAAPATSTTSTPSTPSTAARGESTPTTPAPTPAPTAPPTVAPTTTARPASDVGDPQVDFVTVADLGRPVDLAWRAGDPTLYVVEQAGQVEAVDATSGASRVVLDITDLTDAQGERGFLGLEFHPTGGWAYLNYIDGNGDTVIAEIAVGADGTFDRATTRVLMNLDQPYGNHNGGDLALGPDALLYIGMGDGGSGGDPERRALDLGSPLGKILRIDPTPSADLPYTVPPDNPFTGTEGAVGEVWSIGLRNPWKFTFDPVTHDLWVADVGQNQFEEVDLVPAPADGTVAGRGVSFGWSAYEGSARYNADQPADGHVGPVLTYPHGADGCSISGGAPYRGEAIPDLWGGYVYSDYCSGRIWVLDLAGGRNLHVGTLDSVTAVVAGPDRELYVLSGNGPVSRIVPVS